MATSIVAIAQMLAVPAYADITTLAKAAILMDANSGQILYEKEADLSIPPASMSKMMTIYLVFKALKQGDIKLSDEFTVSENAWRQEGSRMFVKLGDSVKVEDLLRGAIIQSGNDACMVLAEGLSGSEEAFIARMNEVAKELGLENSTFMNPTGLPDENHRMSVRDLATLGRHLVYDFPEYYKIYSEKQFTWNKIKQGNRNPLLYYFKGADGIKTGHTEEAGYGLVGSAKRDDMRLISVVSGLNSDKERRLESVKILGYGFAEFDTVSLQNKNAIAQLPVYLGSQDTVSVTLKDDMKILVKRADRNKISAKIQYETPLVAPINQGDIVGKIYVTLPEKDKPIVGDIIASENIAKADYWGRITTSLNYLLFGAPNYNTNANLVVSDAVLQK